MIRIAKSNPMTRTADAAIYASGDLVAQSVTAAEVTPFSFTATGTTGGKGTIRRVGLHKSDADIVASTFRVHIYRDNPTVTNGDNGVWLSTYSNWLGAFDVIVDKAFAAGATGVGIPLISTAGLAFQAAPNQKRLFALIEARAAYTPSSAEVFTITLDIEE